MPAREYRNHNCIDDGDGKVISRFHPKSNRVTEKTRASKDDTETNC